MLFLLNPHIIAPVGHLIAADEGSYALSGQTAQLRQARLLVAEVGGFALAGQDAALLFDGSKVISADEGVYELLGSDSALLQARLVAAEAGAFALVGQDASQAVGKRVTAEAGGFLLSGEDVALRRTWVVGAAAGSFALPGSDAALRRAGRITADAGAFVLTGTDATLRKGKKVAADAGAFSLTGQDATLTYEGGGIEISAWLNGERAAGAASSAVSFASLSPATGDYLLYIAAADSADGASSLMAPSGYTPIYETTDSNPNGGAWYKKLGAGETSITLPAVASLGTSHVYTMAVLKGVHATTPMDATRTTASGATGDPDCPSITTVTADAMVVAIGLIDDDTVTSVSAYPSGYTNTDFNGGTGASIVMATKLVASPGAENPSAYNTSADDAWWAITLAFRPA